MKEEVNVDFVGKNTGQGEVAESVMANGALDPHKLRPWLGKDGKAYVTVFTGGDAKNEKNYKHMQVNTATLRREEWQQLDDAILPIVESRLQGINDLKSRGLVYNLGNAMGTTVFETHTVSDAMEAELTMDGVARGKGDRPVFNHTYLPIPIIHVDYEINARVLAASRSLGNPLDTTSAERAARRVAEKLESMLFTNTTYKFGGGLIYSYVNFPDRLRYSLHGNWDASSAPGVGIIDDIVGMKAMSIANHYYGPWVVYLPVAYETVMDRDYDTSGQSTQTIRDRILKIGGITDVKVVDTLPANNVLMVQMTSDVVRLINGMAPQNIQWGTEGNLITKYKVMTIQVPQIRSDYNGKTGIVHGA